VLLLSRKIYFFLIKYVGAQFIAPAWRSRERILPGDSLANNQCMNIVSALVRKDRLEIVGMAADGILQSDTVGAKD